MFCTKCGKEAADEQNFCDYCGAPLRKAYPDHKKRTVLDIETSSEKDYFKEENNSFISQPGWEKQVENDTKHDPGLKEQKKAHKAYIVIPIIVVIIAAAGLFLYNQQTNPVGEWIVSSAYAGVEYYDYNIPLPLTTNVELEPLDDGTDISGGRDVDVDMHLFMVGDDDYILDIMKDGTYTLSAFDSIEWGSWIKDDNSSIVFYSNEGDETYASMEDGNIVFLNQDTKYILKRNPN